MLGKSEFWYLREMRIDTLGRKYSVLWICESQCCDRAFSKLNFLWPRSQCFVFVWHWGTLRCGYLNEWITPQNMGYICMLQMWCKSHVELALETKRMSSGERSGDIVVEKEGKDKFLKKQLLLFCVIISRKTESRNECYIVSWKLLVSRCVAWQYKSYIQYHRLLG